MTQSRPSARPPVPGAIAPVAASQARMPTGAGDLTGCPWRDVKAKLREVGLRPTRQRMALGWILFAKGDRHVTAEMLYEEANHAKVPVSLATVYNTLHQFTEVGLLRQVAIDGAKAYFDTTSSSKTVTISWTSPRPTWWSARRRCRPRATRSPASTWSCGCGAKSADCHSGRGSREPGIHNHDSCRTGSCAPSSWTVAMDSGLGPSDRSGM